MVNDVTANICPETIHHAPPMRMTAVSRTISLHQVNSLVWIPFVRFRLGELMTISIQYTSQGGLVLN